MCGVVGCGVGGVGVCVVVGGVVCVDCVGAANVNVGVGVVYGGYGVVVVVVYGVWYYRCCCDCW